MYREAPREEALGSGLAVRHGRTDKAGFRAGRTIENVTPSRARARARARGERMNDRIARGSSSLKLLCNRHVRVKVISGDRNDLRIITTEKLQGGPGPWAQGRRPHLAQGGAHGGREAGCPPSVGAGCPNGVYASPGYTMGTPYVHPGHAARKEIALSRLKSELRANRVRSPISREREIDQKRHVPATRFIPLSRLKGELRGNANGAGVVPETSRARGNPAPRPGPVCGPGNPKATLPAA